MQPDDDSDLGEHEYPDPSDWNDSDEPDLITCPECGKEIIEQTDICPFCGMFVGPAEVKEDRSIWVWVLLVILLGVAVILIFR